MKNISKHIQHIIVIGIPFSVIGNVSPSLASTFQWLEPWQVSLDQKILAGDASARRAFGASATMDGEINDTTNDYAVAKSESIVDPDILVDSVSQTGVEFSRRFQLLGGRFGWAITLSGNLNGRLFINNLSLDPVAIVQAFASVEECFVSGTKSLTSTTNPPPTVNDTKEIIESTTDTDTCWLNDGIYTVDGRLLTTAAIDRATVSTGDAISDFFSGSRSWTVHLKAKKKIERMEKEPNKPQLQDNDSNLGSCSLLVMIRYFLARVIRNSEVGIRKE